ncbi:2Fe-2S iron-sulfur cluster-binding protein [Bdellovibrio bacteriovorus]|uniref:2Fe-2S ferredoxin-type domain-containing protein n=1 Tax=Bdellovibrio bacteriovorus str. Tiberius TaxID=1069642 RepID=K7ZEV6_BDEBC|nr:2Fe-2S iron-sulfur cluster-binding protein [Bdellovibrio bacteriovorus]AFY00867.1 hypothetical protein Bdt_1167 [Bdellovibrio bacteriovorus str. Tiberius]
MKIKFLPQNIEVEGTPDKSLLQIATENKLEIRSICKGVPSCAECRVRISEGDSNILPPTKAELNLIGTSHFIDGRRLSCQVRCYGDVTVDLTEQVQNSENKTKKIRGFRANKQIESKAVNDTMLLSEKPEDRPQHQQADRGGEALEASTEEVSAEAGNQAQPQSQPKQQQPQQKQQQRQQQNRQQQQKQQGGGGGNRQQQGQQKQNQQKQGQQKQGQPKQQQNQKQAQGGGQQNRNQNQNQNRGQNQNKPQNQNPQAQQQQPKQDRKDNK